VMLPSADAVSFTFVKGTRTAFCGNSVAETCSSAGPTVKVTPAVGVTTGVGAVGVVTSAAGVDGVAGVEGVEGVEGVATGAAPNNSFNFARVNEPTYPVPLESPIGASTLDAYLFWNLITAPFVIGPKAIVSLPGEPAPDAASRVSALELSAICKFFTSCPVLPAERSRENVKPIAAVLPPCRVVSCA